MTPKNDPYPYEILDSEDSMVFKYHVKPNVVVWKPCNQRDAHRMLDSIFVKEGVRVDAKTKMIEFHFGFGMWMRNNWGLWSGKTYLSPFFESNGLKHPDDMSGFILDTYQQFVLLRNERPMGLDSLYGAWKDIDCRRGLP